MIRFHVGLTVLIVCLSYANAWAQEDVRYGVVDSATAAVGNLLASEPEIRTADAIQTLDPASGHSSRLSDTAGVAPLTATQWVCPQKPGQFEATVVVTSARGGVAVVESAQVTLSDARGWIGESTTDSRGKVVLRGVQPGVYALTATAPGLLAIYAMHVLPSNHPDARQYSPTAEISCSSLGAQRIEATVLPFLADQYDFAPVFIDERELIPILPSTRGNETLRVRSRNGGLAGTIYAPGTGRGRDWIGIDRYGELDPSDRMNVVLFRGRERLTDQLTSADGRFFFRDLRPDVYTVLAIGPDGVGVLGFELIGEDSPALTNRSSNQQVLVGKKTPVVDEFAMQVVPAELASVVDGLCCGCCCAPSGSFAAGGGGGGVGGGGIGGLAALAALAAAAGSGGDGGSGIFVPPPASSAMMSGSMD